MLRPARIQLLASMLAACGCAMVASAQSAPPPEQKAPAAASKAAPTAPEASAILAQPTAKEETSPAPRRARAISPAVAAQLRAAAAAPEFAPPPPAPAAPATPTPAVDAREVDRPQNGIIRLPEYVVLEKKPQVFTERDVHTDKGLTEIAIRRHISETDYVMNRFYIPLFGDSVKNRALAMYAEQERLNNISTLSDNAIGANMADPAQGSAIRQEAQKTFMRKEDFGWGNGNNTDRK